MDTLKRLPLALLFLRKDASACGSVSALNCI